MALIAIDTNLVIHALAGNVNAAKSIEGNECLISFMAVIELLSWKEIVSQSSLIKKFLSNCIIKDNDAQLQQIVIDTKT